MSTGASSAKFLKQILMLFSLSIHTYNGTWLKTVGQHFRDVKELLQLHPTPVLLPGKSHGWRSLVGYSPWGRQESDTTERLHFHFSLSCIGEGNGNPLQCSCLENPRDRGAWWASIYGVAQSRTWLTRLSSSSSSSSSSSLLLGDADAPGPWTTLQAVTCQCGSVLTISWILLALNLPHFLILVEKWSRSVVSNSLRPHGL